MGKRRLSCVFAAALSMAAVLSAPVSPASAATGIPIDNYAGEGDRIHPGTIKVTRHTTGSDDRASHTLRRADSIGIGAGPLTTHSHRLPGEYEAAWHAQIEPDNLTPAPTGSR